MTGIVPPQTGTATIPADFTYQMTTFSHFAHQMTIFVAVLTPNVDAAGE
jgi:hypothetical protein